MTDSILMFIVAVILGIILMTVVVGITGRFVERRLSKVDQLRLKSLTSVEKLLAQAQKSDLTDEQRRRLWSDLMTYTMNAKSERTARRYVDEASNILGEESESLKKESVRILQRRFHNRDNSIVCQMKN